MITLNEIRVGNWIKGIALGQYHQVDLFFFHEWYDHESIDDGTFGDWYTPIPLSPYILEKCGFEKALEKQFSLHENSVVCTNSGTSALHLALRTLDIGLFEIQYEHITTCPYSLSSATHP